MATIIKRMKYRCYDDCTQGGCPEHEAELLYQSTSDILIWEDGNGRKCGFDLNQLETFLKLLEQISYRGEISATLRRGLSGWNPKERCDE